MKFILLFIFTISLSWAACDAPVSRTNFVANTILTSSDLNTQFNDVFAAANLVDGSCLTDETVTADKLDTSTLGPLVNASQLGCKTEYSNAATLSIDKCFIAINGTLVTTTTATTVTWGDNSGSSEAASTRFYVYALSTSTATALSLSIRTNVPDGNGYNSNDRVISTIFNDASSDIDTYSIDQWHVNEFVAQETGWFSYTPVISGCGTVSNVNFIAKRSGSSLEVQGKWNMGTVTASEMQIGLVNKLKMSAKYTTVFAVGNVERNIGTVVDQVPLATAGDNYFNMSYNNSGSGAIVDTPQNCNAMAGNSEEWFFNGNVDIEDWSY